MNSRERVEATFRGELTDRIPVHHIGFSSDIASALLGREAYVGGGIQQWREAIALWQGQDAHREFVERSFQDAIDIAHLCGHDIVRATYWRYNRRPTRRLDELTFLYEDSAGGRRVLRYDPESEQCTIEDSPPPAVSGMEDLEGHIEAEERTLAEYLPQEADYELEIRAKRLLGHEVVIRVGGVGLEIPLDPPWLAATRLRPDLVVRHLDVQLEKAIRNLRFLAALGFRHFFGGGDLASNDGPLYSPLTFRTLLLPRLQRLAASCHAVGGRLLFASDGNLWAVADDLFGASGIDGFFEVDRRAGMDLARLRQRFRRLTLVGNISSHTVHTGKRAEVVAETLSCLEAARRYGGIVVGASNYLVPGTPIANVEAMLEAIRDGR